MKNSILMMVCLLPAICLAEVPGLINYSGRLNQSDGSPYTNEVDVTVAIYDAEVAGTRLYNENIGTIPVQNGVYSFNFGNGGTSVVTVTEPMGTTDGSKTVFNYTTAHQPVLNPSVTITDGVYSWNDVTGSSSPANFLGSVPSYAAGTSSAIYLSGAPAAGRQISISYRYNETGVSRALLDAAAAWLQVSINGEPLTPRSQLVSVPYSMLASRASLAESAINAQQLEGLAAAEISQLTHFVLLLQNQISEIQASVGLGNDTSLPSFVISDTFSDTNGYRNLVNTNATTSAFVDASYIAAQVLSDSTQYNATAGPQSWVKVRQIDNVSNLVDSVSLQVYGSVGGFQVRVRFVYTNLSQADSTSTPFVDWGWKNYVGENPTPGNQVKSIELWIYNVWSGGNASVAVRNVNAFLIAPSSIVIPLTNAPQSYASMLGISSTREPGDDITYTLTDGAITTTALGLGVKNAMPAGMGPITELRINLTPSDSATFTLGETAIKSFTLKLFQQ